MPLQSSGQISLADIAAEFGGSAPHKLSEYYRGGALVPDTAANAGIPTSGQNKLSDYYGGDAAVGSIQVTSPISVSKSNPGGVVHSGVEFHPDGSIYLVGPGASDLTLYNANEWWTERPQADIGAQYEVACTGINSGSWDTEAASVGSYVAISSVRRWSVTIIGAASPDSQAVNANFTIRKLDNSGPDNFVVDVFASN